MWGNAIAVGLAGLLVGLATCVIGCAPSSGEPENRDTPPVAPASIAPTPPREQAANPVPTVPDADMKALVDGNNAFAIDLYKRLAEKEGNIVVSPYSISSALAMTYAGARGETAEEMAQVMRFTLPPDRLHPAFADLTRRLMGDRRPEAPQTAVANALWAAPGFSVAEPFARLTERHYAAGLRRVDYDRPDAACKEINAWVSDQTRGKIPDLLSPQDLPPSTRLVLTNAVYFRGNWLTPFSKGQTRNETFESKPGVGKAAPLMRRESDDISHYAGATFQLVELPYSGERLSMIVLLPVTRFGLRAVEEKLTAADLHAALGQMKPQRVVVDLPRFSFKTRYELGSPLFEMGSGKSFLGGDFSGIGPGVDLSRVIHAGCVEVDEQGTEAAGATAVAPNPKYIPKIEFRADQPFLFLIRDRQTGTVLFQGRVTEPS